MPTLVPMASGDLEPVWPLPDVWRAVPTSGGRRFGADRSSGERHHAGVDLLAPKGALVVAPEAGEVVALQGFNGPQAKAMLIQTDTGPVILLGEVFPDSWAEFGVSQGSWVDKGDSVARIGVNPGGSTMLHYEMYSPGTRKNHRWYPGKSPPARLRDPTHYLMEAAGQVVIPDHPTLPDTTTPGTTTPGTKLDDRTIMIALGVGIPTAIALTLLLARRR